MFDKHMSRDNNIYTKSSFNGFTLRRSWVLPVRLSDSLLMDATDPPLLFTMCLLSEDGEPILSVSLNGKISVDVGGTVSYPL